MSTRPTLTLAEAADELGVHYMTAYRYVRLGELAATQMDGAWQVSRSALDAFRTRRADRPRVGRRRASGTHPAAATGAVDGVGPRRAGALAARLVEGDQVGAWQIVEAALVSGAGPADVYHSLLSPALRRIGDDWVAGRITIADEHEASVLAMRLIGRLGASAGRPGRPRGSVVVGAVPGDRHALPSAMLADLLRIEGFRVTDLGADAPAAEVAAAAARQDRLVAVGLCATTPVDRSAIARLRRAVGLIRTQAGCPVLLGGHGVSAEQAAAAGADGWTAAARDAVAWFAAATSAAARPPSTMTEESP